MACQKYNELPCCLCSYNEFVGLFMYVHSCRCLKFKLFSSPLLKSSSLPVCVTLAHHIMFLFFPGHDQFTDVFSVNHQC